MKGSFLEPDFAGKLTKMQAPTLILSGDQDALTRDGQAALTVAITGSRQVSNAGAGHGLPWEQPERFAGDLAAFVKNLVIQR